MSPYSHSLRDREEQGGLKLEIFPQNTPEALEELLRFFRERFEHEMPFSIVIRWPQKRRRRKSRKEDA